MTDTLLPIAGAAPAATTNTLLYTAPGSTKSTIFDLMMLNTDAAVAETVEIWVSPLAAGAPSGQDGQLANKVVHHQPLAALERVQMSERFVMSTGDKVYVRSANGTVTFRGSVLEQT